MTLRGRVYVLLVLVAALGILLVLVVSGEEG